MRVVAGRFGGRRLRAPPGRAVTRPTTDRVREAIFSMLGPLSGERVLDLFAGTGALGIEALSRGVSHATFVERDPLAIRALRANLRALHIEEGWGKGAQHGEGADERQGDARPGIGEARVILGEALTAVRTARKAAETYDLVFVDPPYERAGELVDELSALLPRLLAPGARVVVESATRSPAALALEVVRQRGYGDTTVTIHRYSTEDKDEHR